MSAYIKEKYDENGDLMYLVTSSDAIGMSDGSGNLTNYLKKRVTELNISVLYPTLGVDGTNKYTLSGAISLVSSEFRKGGVKITFINEDDDTETWEYLGRGLSWEVDNFFKTGVQKIGEVGSISKIDNIENVEFTYKENYWWNGTDYVSNSGYHCIEKINVKAGDIIFVKGYIGSASSIRLVYLHNSSNEIIYKSESYCSKDLLPVMEDGYIIVNSVKNYTIKIGLVVKETFIKTILDKILKDKEDFNSFFKDYQTSKDDQILLIDKITDTIIGEESGKNLFDKNSIVENTMAQDVEDGNTTGAKCSQWIKLKNVKYTLSNQPQSPQKTYIIAYKKNNEDSISRETARNVGGTSFYVFDNTDGKADCLRFSSYNVADADTILTCQLEEGETMSDYEEYTPPKDVPNPTFFEKYENTSKQFEDFTSDYKIIQRASDNKFDKNSVQIGILDELGNIDDSQNNYITSNYISLRSGEQFKIITFLENVKATQSPAAVCFYDSDKTLIEKASTMGRIMRCLKSNCAFMRFSLWNLYLDSAILLTNDVVDDKIVEYIPYMTENVYVDKNTNEDKKSIAADGDSITFGFKPSESTYPGYAGMNSGESYIDLVAHDLNVDLFKFAVTASTIAYFSDGSNPKDALVDRYTLLPDDVDLVYIAGGTNDWAYNDVLLGQYGDTEKTTFYGALKILCEGLKQKYPSTPIVFATPIKRRLEGRGDYDNRKGYPNSEGKYIEDYGNAIKEVCGYFGYPVVDMEKISIVNAWLDGDIEKLIPDGIHPNKLGHRLMKNPCKQNTSVYFDVE